jgi:hypothetical protein
MIPFSSQLTNVADKKLANRSERSGETLSLDGPGRPRAASLPGFVLVLHSSGPCVISRGPVGWCPRGGEANGGAPIFSWRRR